MEHTHSNINPVMNILWHIHQPLFIPDHEIIRQVKESYILILQIHEKLAVPFSLNITGALLERISTLQPEFINMVHNLQRKKLLEITGSGYYHPLFPLLSQEYAVMQIQKDLDLKKRLFNVEPKGFWPTDLGWVPWLTPILKNLGFSWVVIDSPSLTLSNALPQWKQIDLNGHAVLYPEVESISLYEEAHELYTTTLKNKRITVFIRDHKLSLELTDFEKGVIFNQGLVEKFVDKIISLSAPQTTLTIAEDGERINTQTARNYQLFLAELLDRKKVNFVKPSNIFSEDLEHKDRYFPSSTFQYDLSPWLSTMDDQTYIAYLSYVESRIFSLEVLLMQHKDIKKASKHLLDAKQQLLKAQDSGCIFWKFHQRTRVFGWECAMNALESSQKGLALLSNG